MTTLLILAAFVALSIVLQGFFLWISTRIFRVPRGGFLRALSTGLLAWLLGMGLGFGLLIFRPESETLKLVLAIGEFALSILSLLLVWLLFARMFQSSFGRAIIVSLPWLGLNALYGVAVVMLLKILVGMYILPTGSMSPTLLGKHYTATCPHCSEKLVVPARIVPMDHAFDLPEKQLAICSNCLKTAQVVEHDKTIHSQDRFICNKLLTPQRWDLVVFRYPKDPSIKYVRRLVGLPGEKVVIKDGHVWIDDKKLEPPPDIANLEFADETSVFGEVRNPVNWGTATNPMILGRDEYFVVGDFSLRSADSRIWGVLAETNIEGVVTMIYWPPSRWRVFR